MQARPFGQPRPLGSATSVLFTTVITGRDRDPCLLWRQWVQRWARGWPGQVHGRPVQLFAAATQTRRRHRHNLLFPLAGLVPAIHAFPAVRKAAFEDVGGRGKPGQGDLRVYRASQTTVVRATGQPWINFGHDGFPLSTSHLNSGNEHGGEG